MSDRPRIELDPSAMPSFASRSSSVDTLERFDYIEPESEKKAFLKKRLRDQDQLNESSATQPDTPGTSHSSELGFNSAMPFNQNNFPPGPPPFDPHHPMYMPHGNEPLPPYTPDYGYTPATPLPPYHNQGLPPHPQTPSHHGPPPLTPHHPLFNDNFGPPMPHGPGHMPFDMQSPFHHDMPNNMPGPGPPPPMFDHSGPGNRMDERDWRRRPGLDTPASMSTPSSHATPSPVPHNNMPPRFRDPRSEKPPPLEMPREIPMENVAPQEDTPEADVDEEPRFMSLESRIQSLLQGGSEAEDKDDGKSMVEVPEPDLPPPPVSMSAPMPLPHIPPQDMMPPWDPNGMHMHMPPMGPPMGHQPPHHHLPPPPHHPPLMQPLPPGVPPGLPPPHMGPPPHNMDLWQGNGVPPHPNMGWAPPPMDGPPPHQPFEPPRPQNIRGGPPPKGRGKNKKKNRNKGGKFGNNNPSFQPPESICRLPLSENKRDNRKKVASPPAESVPAAKMNLDFKSPFSEDPQQSPSNGQDKVDIEDDRMSLDSVSSGEERLEVNPVNSSHPAFNNDWLGNPCDNFMGFNPDYDPEADYVTHMFNTVLNEFVKELKSIMQRDLCKKMVETSAFKYFENWWDQQEEKHKVSRLFTIFSF